MDRKIYTSEIKQIGDEENRTLRFITSTETIDRDGDILKVDGWKLDNYLKNPVILYGHNYGGLPVGRSVKIEKDNINKKLVQDVQFAKREEYEFADTVYRLAKGGYLNATSVGFIGIRQEPRLSEEGEHLGIIFQEQELLETSIVPVPSNPTALMEARSKGIIDEKELKILEEGDKKMEKTVISYRKYPLDDEAAAWDGPAEIREADVAQLKLMSTWFDSENADSKSSYKLPHHRASNLNTVWRGTAASMAALLGARGGVDIPENDRQGVYNHLVKHYKEFDKEAPDLRSYSEIELKEMFPEKSGATLSAKTVETLTSAIKSIQAGINSINSLLPDGEERNTTILEVKIEMSDELKQAFEDIKKEIESLKDVRKKESKEVRKKENKVEIDLDSIELPKNAKVTALDELNIEPEELKKMMKESMKEIIQETIQGGN